MKTLLLSLALIAFVFVSCDKSQAPTDPQTSGNTILKAEQGKDVTITVPFYNACCDEYVVLQGTAHIVSRDNGTHFNVTDISGVGTLGNSYTGHNTAVHNTLDNTGNGASNSSTVLELNVTNDEGCSFKLKIHFHFTTDANGETTAVIESIETQCRD
jgi:hypothetical protein